MKRTFVAVATVLLVAAASSQAGYLEEDTQTIRADVVFDSETFDSANVGLELGVGTALYSLDDVGLFGSASVTEDKDRFKSVGIYVEENYPIALGLAPFAGVGVGYGWQDVDGGNAAEDIFGRVQGGLNVILSESVALSGAVRYAFASNDLFLRDGELRDSRVEVTFGIRFYY